MGSKFPVCWLLACVRMVWKSFQGRSAQHRAFPRIRFFLPGMNFNFWLFQINLPWGSHSVHSQTGSSSLMEKTTGFWILHLTGRSEISLFSAKLRNTWQQRRKPAEAEKPFAGSSRSRNKPGSLKINQNSARFSANEAIIHTTERHLVRNEQVVLHN